MVLNIFSLWLLALQVCSPGNDRENVPEPHSAASLKEVFKDHFYIGAALNAGQISGRDTAARALLLREFNSITAENVMKWEAIHPAADSFNFRLPDQMVKLGEENNMFIVGHNLVWHKQLADDVYKEAANGPDGVSDQVDSATLIGRIRVHIQTIVGRYKGRIHGWDVVNEAINEDGSFRESPFFTIAGKAYIHKAFEFAHAADADAELYYNDYGLWKPAKRKGVIRMIREMQNKGIPINGIGIQGHWGLYHPSLEMIEETLLDLSALGLDLHISELDIDVLPDPSDGKGANPYTGGLPDSVQQRLAERYAGIFKLLLKHRDKIKRVTFWGLHDGQSWLNNYPVRGRRNYPLLFDRTLKSKPAFFKVLKTTAANTPEGDPFHTPLR